MKQTLTLLPALLLTPWAALHAADTTKPVQRPNVISSVLKLAALLLALNGVNVSGKDTLPSLKEGKAPQTFEAMWAGFDPRSEPLDVEVLKEWEEDGVVLKVLRYRIGVFKGQKAMMAAVYGCPKGGSKLPGLVQIHGGGQYADYLAPLSNAKRGYATISIAWAGRIAAPDYQVNPDVVKLFWEGKTNDPHYRVSTDWGALDGYHSPTRNPGSDFNGIAPAAWTLDAEVSPRNSPWFLSALAARRALTFLEQQPEVDASRLGVYGHSMGGKLTVLTAAADARVKAAAPSCGGMSDRSNASPLYPVTIGDDANLRRVTCPIMFLSPANDFHGRINDLQTAVKQIKSTDWRVTCSAHLNHQDNAEGEVATQLWFDQVLMKTFTTPKTPEAALDLKTQSGVPSFTVKADAVAPVQSVDIYYTQQGQMDGEKDDTKNTINRFWHHAMATRRGDLWTAELPLLSTDKPLWVYANVVYPLAKPVAGVGYYYRPYTATNFNLSSRMQVVTAAELKASAVKATLKLSTVIEAFAGNWQKEWFTYKPENWARSTHKIYDPQWRAPASAKLALDVRAVKPNKFVVGLDEFATEVSLAGGAEWQSVTLAPADFHDAEDKVLLSWAGLKELRLGALETFRSEKEGAKPVSLGGDWKGAAPEFRNLRWEGGDHLNNAPATPARWIDVLRASPASAVLVGSGKVDASVVQVTRSWKGAVCMTTVINHGKTPVKLVRVDLFDFQHGLPGSTPFYAESFQMLAQNGGTLEAPEDWGSCSDRAHYKLDEPDGLRTAHGMLLLDPLGEDQLLLGFASCRRFDGRFSFDAKRLLVSIDCEGLALAPGETWQLEEFFCNAGPSRDALLNELGTRIEENHPRRTGHKSPPMGWCSWYYFGPKVTAPDIRRNLDWIATNAPQLRYIQIDDGYQSWMGDWLATGNSFDGGIKSVLREIHERGFEPAIWLAPFVASPESKLFHDHPDWFVKDAVGQPLCSDKVGFGGWRLGPWYVLDGTHPEAQKYLEKVFRTMRDEWGCTYFKLDANYWGALSHGHFYDAKATRIEAYRRGMAAALRGAGGAFILGCNHPIWPSLGLLDGARSSTDMSRDWKSICAAGRQNLLRGWENGRFWWNDPDCALLSPGKGKDIGGKTSDATGLPPNEVMFHATTVHASGGMMLNGDDLPTLAAERLTMLKKLMPPTGRAASFDDETLSVGRTPNGGGEYIYLFNWGEISVDRVVLLPHRVGLKNYWTGESLGEHESEYRVTSLAPHTALMLEATPCKKR